MRGGWCSEGGGGWTDGEEVVLLEVVWGCEVETLWPGKHFISTDVPRGIGRYGTFRLRPACYDRNFTAWLRLVRRSANHGIAIVPSQDRGL